MLNKVEKKHGAKIQVKAEDFDGAKGTKKMKKQKNTKVWGVAAGVVGVVLVIIIAVVLRYVLALNGFLDKVTDWGVEKKSYSVAVLNDSEVQELANLNGKSVGFLATDPKAANAEQHLQSQVKIEASYYDDVETLVSVLTGRIVAAMTLETSRLEALQEEGVVTDVRVIYTFEIELDSEDAAVDKEITMEPFVVYISGSDSRAGVKATARSDVNIVAVVNPQTGKILLVSIPRDTYVQLHGTTGLKDKLTHAGIYGADMSKTTIEDFLGIDIDYTIKVSFDTVVKVVDQIDGIEINSDQEMTLRAEGKDKTCHYVVGAQKVDGDCALRFARERKSYTTGDRHRGENQQQVIASIIGKLSGSRDYLLKVPAILDIAADSFETSLSRDDVMAFLRMQLMDGIDWEVESISVDGAGSMQPTYSMGANWPLYVMLPYDASVANATAKIKEYLVVPEAAEGAAESSETAGEAAEDSADGAGAAEGSLKQNE